MSASSTPSTDGRPVALVTGASRGIGREIAALLAERGYRVLGTSRAPELIAGSQRVAGVAYLPLDLESEESVHRCAAMAGPVDVLVANAGRSQIGAFEHVPAESLRKLFEVNVFGSVNLIRLCLPAMRERERGTVIAIGSLIAEFPVPFQSTYAATKLALQGFVQSLRTEVRPFGIRVVLVQPGDCRTDIQQHIERIAPDESPYATAMTTMSERARQAVEGAAHPRAVAEKVWKVISGKRPAPVYSVGPEGPMLTFAKRLVPRSEVERLVAQRYGS